MVDVVQRFDNMVGHIISINDERDVIPLLLGLKEMWPQVLDELRTHGANRYWEGRWRDEKAENDRLSEQCRGLYQAAMNNGQDLLLKEAEIERLRGAQTMTQEKPRPLSEWHEDIGPVLWWLFPTDEPPYVGTPNDVGGWPGYHTHWTPIPKPGPV